MNNLNLENLKAGDEVTVIFVNPSHNRDGRKYSGPKKVVWDEKSQCLRTISMTGDKIPLDGKGYFFMSKRVNPDYYFSANPEHLKAAKRANSRIKAKEKKKNDLLSEKRSALSPLLSSYDGDEENYSFEYLSTDSLERLTIKQIETLKNWLAAK